MALPFKIPLNLQIASNRLGLIFAPLFGVQAKIEQSVFYKDGFRVPVYKSIDQVTAATAKLKWTADPWDGKLDVIKHPTFMQQAIEQHPDYAGDCDDFAAYWCVALAKSKLADEQWFASGLWVDKNKNEIAGHAVCVFRTGDKWFYAGNWNSCVPIPVASSTAWVADMETRASTKIFSAVMWAASGASDDTLLLNRSVVARR